MLLLIVIIYITLHIKNNFNLKFSKYLSKFLDKRIFCKKLYISYFPSCLAEMVWVIKFALHMHVPITYQRTF